MLSTSPTLWIVATPIGNPGDLSPRAREVLREADLILAEDTRRASRLFADLGFAGRKVLSFFEHNELERQEEVLALLRAGSDAALISDAGTPALADPGYRLARACRKEGIRVSPVPGACAPIAALSAAGIAPAPFSFLGFLPRGKGDREKLFIRYRDCGGTIVFFERKDRLKESLAIALNCLGDRELAICRELTKTYEEFIIGRLGESANLADNVLGEITAIIGPAEEIRKTSPCEARKILAEELGRGLKSKDAAKSAKKRTNGWSARELYDLSIRLEDERK